MAKQNFRRDRECVLRWAKILPDLAYATEFVDAKRLRRKRREFRDTAGLPFVVSTDHIAVWATLINHSHDLTQDQAQCRVSLTVISLYTGISENDVTSVLSDLHDLGLIRRVSAGIKQVSVTHMFTTPRELGEDTFVQDADIDASYGHFCRTFFCTTQVPTGVKAAELRESVTKAIERSSLREFQTLTYLLATAAYNTRRKKITAEIGGAESPAKYLDKWYDKWFQALSDEIRDYIDTRTMSNG